jgi:Sigma-70 region 2
MQLAAQARKRGNQVSLRSRPHCETIRWYSRAPTSRTGWTRRSTGASSCRALATISQPLRAPASNAAEDLAQQTRIAAWTHAPRAGAADLRAWMHVVARNFARRTQRDGAACDARTARRARRTRRRAGPTPLGAFDSESNALNRCSSKRRARFPPRVRTCPKRSRPTPDAGDACGRRWGARASSGSRCRRVEPVHHAANSSLESNGSPRLRRRPADEATRPGGSTR